jgi:phage antirepressor YoqD-like protein
METKQEKIFVNGIISKEVPQTAPDFILGKMSIKVDDLMKWLIENKSLCDENGWINMTVMRSKSTGKRYIEVDTWKPTPSSVDTGEAPLDTVPF